MPYTIRIRFSGLCAFVPSTLTTTGEAAAMDVLLVNSANPNAAKLSKNLPAHTPFLKFDLANLSGSTANGGVASGLWKLQDDQVNPPRYEDLALRAVPKDGSPERPFDTPFQAFLPAKVATLEKPIEDLTIVDVSARRADLADQNAAFSWVPSIQDGLPSAALVDRDWRAKKLAGARIHLDRGLLQTEQLGKYAKQEVIAQLLPTSAASPRRSAIANWVVLRIDNVPDNVDLKIEGTDLSTGNPTRELTLVSRNSLDLVVDITNLCCGYAVSGAGYTVTVPSADDDFELFYTLVQDFDQLKANAVRFPIPTPVVFPIASQAEVQAGQSGGADPIHCTLCRFSGYSQ